MFSCECNILFFNGSYTWDIYYHNPWVFILMFSSLFMAVFKACCGSIHKICTDVRVVLCTIICSSQLLVVTDFIGISLADLCMCYNALTSFFFFQLFLQTGESQPWPSQDSRSSWLWLVWSPPHHVLVATL